MSYCKMKTKNYEKFIEKAVFEEVKNGYWTFKGETGQIYNLNFYCVKHDIRAKLKKGDMVDIFYKASAFNGFFYACI